MSRWTCPACDREFGRANQSHVCVPGCTEDECFAGRPPVQREIYEEILAELETLGPVHKDTVSVGVFLKRARTIGEVRPKARALTLMLWLPRIVDDPRIDRRFPQSGDRVVHVLKFTDAAQVDDQVRDWLAEAYDAASS